jgi:hypothetical protein
MQFFGTARAKNENRPKQFLGNIFHFTVSKLHEKSFPRLPRLIWRNALLVNLNLVEK